MGPGPPQTESTYELARRAIAAGNAAEGVRRIRQLLDEVTEGRELFPLFIERTRRFLLDRGVPPAAVPPQLVPAEAYRRVGSAKPRGGHDA